MKKLVTKNYFWLSLKKDVETYVKGCDICLVLKTVKYKPYGDLQFLSIATQYWKNLFIDFMIGLPISMDYKRNSYNSILIIMDRLTKMV